MPQLTIPQCDRSLDFAPLAPWPRAFPAMRWRSRLLTAFDRNEGATVDLSQDGVSLSEALIACYPELGFAELARLEAVLNPSDSDAMAELVEEYGLRLSDRMLSSLRALVRTPREFQDFVDEKKMSARDLAPLLALREGDDLTAFLRGLAHSALSKSQATSLLENGIELHLLGAESILRLQDESDTAYLARLEKLRKPMSSSRDEELKAQVRGWAWPAQVQGSWQRFGDQSGLEIRLRTTSPQDLAKKLERLGAIREKWSCSN